MKTYYVYILQCSDKTYYTGITNNLDRRIEEHISGFNKDSYTSKRRPVVLKFFTRFTDPNAAILFEKKIKKWSAKKKEALINEDYEKLVELSKCHSKVMRSEMKEVGKENKEV
jgi:putative endonuclease